MKKDLNNHVIKDSSGEYDKLNEFLNDLFRKYKVIKNSKRSEVLEIENVLNSTAKDESSKVKLMSLIEAQNEAILKLIEIINRLRSAVEKGDEITLTPDNLNNIFNKFSKQDEEINTLKNEINEIKSNYNKTINDEVISNGSVSSLNDRSRKIPLNIIIPKNNIQFNGTMNYINKKVDTNTGKYSSSKYKKFINNINAKKRILKISSSMPNITSNSRQTKISRYNDKNNSKCNVFNKAK